MTLTFSTAIHTILYAIQLAIAWTFIALVTFTFVRWIFFAATSRKESGNELRKER